MIATASSSLVRSTPANAGPLRKSPTAIPAKAGIQLGDVCASFETLRNWAPASAGVVRSFERCRDFRKSPAFAGVVDDGVTGIRP